MKVLIIGFGSIGKRHFSIIKNNFKFAKIFILSRRNLNIRGAKVNKNINEIKNIKFNYIIIANETSQHYSTLKYLEENFKNTKILIEKPLFHKYINLKSKNKIFIGYNLRFHPGVILFKKLIKNQSIFNIKVIANSYLPNWRKNDYSQSYSANSKKGGGVILDLSHEIDLAMWIFGNIKIVNCYQGKISNLQISSEDYLKIFGKIKKSNFYLELSYFSKNETRSIQVDTNKNSILLNLKKNYLKIDNKKSKIFKYSMDKSYLDMHKAIIYNKNSDCLCSYEKGKKILKLIQKIKKFENKSKKYL